MRRKVLTGLAVLVIGASVMVAFRSFGTPSVVRNANSVTLMCAQSGRLFQVRLTPATTPFPHENPKTGSRTLYPTEVCHWGECGRRGGTYVILNSWLGKPGPTHCPVCGKVVRVHNPGPGTAGQGE